GEIDELMEKYKTRAYSGGLLVEGDEVYYMLPDYYQIYRVGPWGREGILKEEASHFEQVSIPIINWREDWKTHSSMYGFFKENGLWFVISIPPENKYDRIRNEEGKLFITDIFNKDGYLVKEGIFFGSDIEHVPKKFAPGKYITYDSSESLIIILTYKYTDEK
ncbi:MAG: hypothetical protein K9N07_11715, partial [Candidatus Cloacimonetes bacterium]|nr:hypothetical protein [Candidatus Cloacimonadota bacterium]